MSERPGRALHLSILVMPDQENTLGVMHGGHMLSWMDMAAWVAATRAVAPGQTVFFKAVTTACGPAVHAGEVCHVTARVAEVGATSMRVTLEARAEDPSRRRSATCAAPSSRWSTRRTGTPSPSASHQGAPPGPER